MTKAFVDTLKHNLREALRQARFQDAEEILARLKKEDPLSRETRGMELEFYLNSNRLSEANELARQLCTLFPDSGRIFFLAGKLAYRQKRYEEAASYFRESQRLFPHWQTQYWLGKTLTQSGQFEEAESLLLPARDHNVHALLDLAWLYDRKNDLDAALQAYQEYLELQPGHEFATKQITSIKARMLEPEAFIEEIDQMSEWGEEISDTLFPDFVQRLFETGQGPRARTEITERLGKMDARLGTRVAWICYKAQAYDLACTLFLQYLQTNISNVKYLTALETAAHKSDRLLQVLEAYRPLSPQARHLYGRSRTLGRRIQERRQEGDDRE